VVSNDKLWKNSGFDLPTCQVSLRRTARNTNLINSGLLPFIKRDDSIRLTSGQNLSSILSNSIMQNKMTYAKAKFYVVNNRKKSILL
jgi:hypothetical protein